MPILLDANKEMLVVMDEDVVYTLDALVYFVKGAPLTSAFAVHREEVVWHLLMKEQVVNGVDNAVKENLTTFSEKMTGEFIFEKNTKKLVEHVELAMANPRISFRVPNKTT